MRIGIGSASHMPIENLRKDLRAVAQDTEALLRATADVAGDRVQEARARAQESLRRATNRGYDRRLRERARELAQTTDVYVRDHTWSMLGAGLGLGLLAGFLLRRH